MTEAKTNTFLFEIKNRFTGEVQVTAELAAEYRNKSYRLQLGAAVKWAVEARANLAGANLTRANLAGANLAGANLAGANLTRANLADANLADANLTDANLADAYLAGANLTRAYLAGANLAGAYLADARGIKYIDGGADRRGYRFYALADKDGNWVIRAGCRRWESIEDARVHFDPDIYGSDGDTAECLARLELIWSQMQAQGWLESVKESAQ